MELIFVRHGQPAWNDDGRAVVDPPLTDLGERQAKRMAEALHDQPFDEVYASPLRRARQTATPLFAALGREERIAEWLREIKEPDWHGSPTEHVAEQFAASDAKPAHERWNGIEGGESIREFVDRIHAGGERFLAERGITRLDDELPVWQIDEPDRTLAFIAHAGTNSVALGLLLGIAPTPWEWDRLALRHASITRLVSKPASGGRIFRLTEFSSVEHLADDERTE